MLSARFWPTLNLSSYGTPIFSGVLSVTPSTHPLIPRVSACGAGVGAAGGSTANPFSGLQMIGWLVPLQGPQRGELFTLGSQTTVGKDPSACTLVLQDSYMSSKHAEIKIEAGSWILKDLGSTNGTYVNDKRVDKQELVDNDFIKFGQFLCKFKSL